MQKRKIHIFDIDIVPRVNNIDHLESKFWGVGGSRQGIKLVVPIAESCTTRIIGHSWPFSISHNLTY